MKKLVSWIYRLMIRELDSPLERASRFTLAGERVWTGKTTALQQLRGAVLTAAFEIEYSLDRVLPGIVRGYRRGFVASVVSNK